MFNKKHNATCYHMVRDSQAAKTICAGWNNGNYNQSDLLTKMPISIKNYGIVREIFGWRGNDIVTLEDNTSI